MKSFAVLRCEIAIISLIIFALAVGTARAGEWSAFGTGTNGRVRALAYNESDILFAGGDFTTAGGNPALRVASWNGSSWSALGGGINGAVYALAASGASDLYAGGEFTEAGGNAAYKVAHWNGVSWSAVGVTAHPGIDSGYGVYALAVDASNNLYAGGSFTTADGVTVNNIAKWNGASWSALGTGVNGDVWALAFDNVGNLYVGGSFTEAGGSPANKIARWNGSSWSALGDGVDGYVDALAGDTVGNIYVGGRFTTAGGASANRVARWDGAAWHALGNGILATSGNGVAALAPDPDGTTSVYAGGNFYSAGAIPVDNAARWNGSQWVAMDSGTNTPVSAMCWLTPGAIAAGGNFTLAGGVSVNNIARWDDSDCATYSERLTVVNNCGDDAWMWIIPPGPDIAEAQSQFWQTENGATQVCKGTDCSNRNYQWKIVIPAGQQKTFKIPDCGSSSNKYYFNLGCTVTAGDYAEWGDCKIGGRFGVTDLGNDVSGSNTWLEVTWGCKSGAVCVKNPSSPADDLTAVDWMDISVVDGYTIPMTLTLDSGEGAGHNCQYNSGQNWDGVEEAWFLDLASCPRETTKSLWTTQSALEPVLSGAGLSLLTLNTDHTDIPMNCVAPYKWFSSEYLGDTVAGVSRPLASNIQVFADLNEVNWYGCKAKCGQTAGTPECVCPECSPEACLRGPLGNTQKNVARTNYVRTLKAMGLKAYSWQYDDNSGNKHCDQGVHLTLTLCPAMANQKPYETQYWQYQAGSNTCSAVGSPGPGIYTSYYECMTTNATYELVLDHNVAYCVPSTTGQYETFAECNAVRQHTGSPLNLLLGELN